MFTIPLGDGTTQVQVDGNLDPSLPLVVLLHGFGGSMDDMTNPIAPYGPLAFRPKAQLFLRTRTGG